MRGESYMQHDGSQVSTWLDRAKGNLVLAKQPKPDEAFWEDFCFNIQQAVEKALKAVCIHEKVDFRYTHNIGELITTLKKGGISVTTEVQAAEILTQYAVATRYPSFDEPVTELEFKEALEIAENVMAWVEQRIGSGDN